MDKVGQIRVIDDIFCELRMVNFPKLSQHFIQPKQLIQKIQQRFLIVKSITKETVVNNFIIIIAKIDQILSKIYENFEQIKGS